MTRLPILVLALSCALPYCCQGQSNATTAPDEARRADRTTTGTPPDYRLGAGDEITVFVSDLEELNKRPARVDLQGDVNLPLVGGIHALGLTTQEIAREIRIRLAPILKQPDVIVDVSEFRSQPISVLGAVNNPGVHQLEGHKGLFQVLSEAGGIRSDAGSKLWITRDLRWGRLPLPNETEDASGQFSVASVNVKDVLNAAGPAENIQVKPNDVITVTKDEVVYCVGSVHKAGGFALGENNSLSALQVLSLAEGLDKDAASAQAKILRLSAGASTRTEIPINIKRLMAGRAPDVPLRAGDILFIPNSAAKTAVTRTVETIVQTASGLAIYGRY